MKKFLLLFLMSTNALAQGDPAPFIKGQSSTGLGNVGSTIFVPENQSTKINAYQALIETGNKNILINPSFEHQTVGTGWTVGTGNVLDPTFLASTRYYGLKAGSLTTSSTVPFDFKQCVTPLLGTSGGQAEVKLVTAVPSGVTDAQVCSQVNNVDQNCVSTINDGRYYPYTIPTVFGTAGQNVCIKLKTTASYAAGTQTILVDDAMIRPGLSTVPLAGDVVYSAKISNTGIVTQENTEWINGNCSVASAAYSCPLKTGLASLPLNCVIQVENATSLVRTANLDTYTAANVAFRTFEAGAPTALSTYISCEKQGIDYTAATGNAYQSFNADSSWTPCSFSTLVWPGLGTVTNNLDCKRSGDTLRMRGRFTTGTTSATTSKIPLPSNWGVINHKIITTSSVGSLLREVAGTNVFFNALGNSSVLDGINISGALVSSSTDASIPTNSQFNTGDRIEINGELIIPISSWIENGNIVGSFVGVPIVPGLAVGQKVDTFSLSFGSANAGTQSVTPCTSSPCALDQIGTAVTNVTRTVTGSYLVNFARTYVKAKCSGASAQSNNQGQQLVDFSCLNCSSLPVSIGTPGTAAYDSHPNLICQGSY